MESILIVDDEKNYTAVLSVVLQEEGYETLTANSAAEALATLKIEDVDLVVTDMKMPGMDGLELLGRVKQQWPDIPVIMMTAHGTVDKAVEAMQKGAYTFILKPFDNERLVPRNPFGARPQPGYFLVSRSSILMNSTSTSPRRSERMKFALSTVSCVWSG